jgi:hypothetical protein
MGHEVLEMVAIIIISDDIVDRLIGHTDRTYDLHWFIIER